MCVFELMISEESGFPRPEILEDLVFVNVLQSPFSTLTCWGPSCPDLNHRRVFSPLGAVVGNSRFGGKWNRRVAIHDAMENDRKRSQFKCISLIRCVHRFALKKKKEGRGGGEGRRTRRHSVGRRDRDELLALCRTIFYTRRTMDAVCLYYCARNEEAIGRWA